MFFIPYATDAPVYHFPWGTIGLIAVNVLAFIASSADPEAASEWILQYGQGLHPLQWITSNFLHADFMHLAGNMVFLWSFGLIVEGKLGWARFIPLYLALGAIESVAIQGWMLSESEMIGCLGASGVISGLMMISVLWAPVNELSCFYLVFVGIWGRAGTFEISIAKFGAFYIGVQVLFLWLSGFAHSSEALHLAGATVGLAAGAAMLKLNAVDCEGWDLFSKFFPQWNWAVTAGPARRKKKRTRSEKSAPVPAADADPAETSPRSPAKSVRKLQALLAERRGQAAFDVLQKIRHLSPDWNPAEPDLRNLIDLLQKDRDWGKCVPLMQEYLAQHEEHAVEIRLRLATILIDEQQRPAFGQRVLAALPPPGTLTEQYEKHRERLLARARELEEDGVIELEGRAWNETP